MDLECKRVSIVGKKMSPFGRVVMEIFEFFCVELLTRHSIELVTSEKSLLTSAFLNSNSGLSMCLVSKKTLRKPLSLVKISADLADI